MGTIITGGIAFIAGLGLAGATVIGITQAQQNSGEEPVDATSVSYGSNG